MTDTTNKFTEVTLELPWETVDQCNGFGLDFGGSALKVVYLHIEDWQEPGRRNSQTVQLRCFNISRTDYEEALKYLKDRVCIRRMTEDEKPLIYTTGVGGSLHSSKIQETFNIRTCNIGEFDCFFAGFSYIVKNVKSKDLVHELNQQLIQKTIERARTMYEVLGNVKKESKLMVTEPLTLKMSDAKFPQEQPLEGKKKFTDYEDIFPCFVVMLGSNGGVFMVNEDGTCQFVNDTRRSGRVFLGVGSALSNAKSYEELMAKAEKGNMRNIHEYVTDLTVDGMEDESENMYTNMEDNVDDPLPAFMFGKCVFKDIKKFREEDFARSYHFVMCSDLVQCTYLPTRIYKDVRHVFFAGGFPCHPLTRDTMLAEWLRREAESLSFFTRDYLCHTHFMKHGSFFGAIGAYLNQMLKFKSTRDIPSEKSTDKDC